MTTVRMLIFIAGARNGEPWPEVGGTITVGDAEAENLIANGYAEAAEEDTDAPKPKASRGRGKKAAEDSDSEPAGDSNEGAAEDGDAG